MREIELVELGDSGYTRAEIASIMGDTDDVPAPAGGSALAVMPDEDLVDALADVTSHIERAELSLQPDYENRRALQDEIICRMTARNAQKLATPRFVIDLIRNKRKDVRVDVLQQLIGLVPEQELSKGLYKVVPPAQWKTNLTYLKPLARYGGAVQQILHEAVVEVEIGSPRLSIESIEGAA